MDSTASLLSPRSAPSSPFSFSPLNSPRALSAPSSSCCGSPSSSASFSFSPLPSPRPISASASASSTLRTSTAFPDLDSSASPFWGSAKPFSTPLQPPPAARCRPPAIDISNYATTTEASPKHWVPSTRRTHYTLLGVSPSASPQEIRVAYRKLALQHHPDVSPLHQLDQSTKLFAEINEAYETLADPQKKACYDLKLALDSPGAGMSSPLHYQSSPSPRMYTDLSTGRVYPSMNSFYREWRRTQS